MRNCVVMECQFIDLIPHVNEVGLLMFLRTNMNVPISRPRESALFSVIALDFWNVIFYVVFRHHLIKKTFSYKKFLEFSKIFFPVVIKSTSKTVWKLKCNIHQSATSEEQKRKAFLATGLEVRASWLVLNLGFPWV